MGNILCASDKVAECMRCSIWLASPAVDEHVPALELAADPTRTSGRRYFRSPGIESVSIRSQNAGTRCVILPDLYQGSL